MVVLILWLFIFSALHASTIDPFLDYQKHLSGMGSFSNKPYRPDLLEAARNDENGISWQDYQFLKGTSACAAPGTAWAHEDGIRGNGVTVLLLENSGINHSDMRKIVEAGSPETPISHPYEMADHGSAMASLIHAVAPEAIIRVRPIDEVDISLSGVRVINASFGSEELEGFSHCFSNIATNDNVLIVNASGNDQEDLSTHPYTRNCDRLLAFTIFAGNLRQDYKTRTSSGFPGESSKFQQSFLWVVGNKVLTATGPDESTEYSPTSGTSNSAAILSAAAALILSKHPTLNIKEVKEILLESADRDIFQEYGSGYRALHIPDTSVAYYRQQSQARKGVDSLSTIQKEHTPIVAYNPKFWGKGILNIKNALLYARLKIAHPEMSINDLRERMLRFLNIKQQVKAEKIQRVFRSRNTLTAEEILMRPTLTLNVALPSRKFEEASNYIPRKSFSKPIRELTDDERLEKLGITLPKDTRNIRSTSYTYAQTLTLSEWQPCKVPKNASEKLAAFIRADKYKLEKTFYDFFLSEFSLQFETPEAIAGRIISTYEKLLTTPFEVNRVIYLYRDWSELDVSYVSKYTHEPVTIIGLIHDSVRNRDNVDKRVVAQIAMHLFKGIQERNVMNNFVKAEILALLKDNQQEDDTTILPFVVQNDLLRVSFKAFEVKYDEETDMHNLEIRKMRGKDLFSADELESFLKAQRENDKNS